MNPDSIILDLIARLHGEKISLQQQNAELRKQIETLTAKATKK